MEDSWKTSLMTGDQCDVCEQALDESAVEIEEHGRILQVCGSCAIRRGQVRLPGPGDPAEEFVRHATERAKIVEELIEHRREEESQLQGLAEFTGHLAVQLKALTEHAAELEDELRTTRADLAAARERLRRLQNTDVTREHPPAPAESAEAADSAEVAPHFPAPAPSVPLGGADSFTLEELREVQRIFNESPYTEKLRSIRRSLGRPVVHLDPVAGEEPKILATIAWEIVWYQFMVDLTEDPTDERVTLFGEGMELTELDGRFHQGNAILDDQGRIDASELEYELVKEEGEVISDASPEQAALEDATEEVWDRQNTPEFRWDD